MRQSFRQQSVLIVLLALILSFAIAGCASWGQLTKEQKTRVVLSFMQDELINLRSGAVTWALNLPETTEAEIDKKREILTAIHEKVLPACKMANEMIMDLAEEAQEGTIDVESAKRLINPWINKVVVLLAALGYLQGG